MVVGKYPVEAPVPAGAVRSAIRQRAWIVYLVLAACASMAYLIPTSPFQLGPIYNLLGFSGVIAILFGVWLNKPKDKLPWLLFAAGLFLFISGDVVAYNYPAFFGEDLPFPSWADPLYLSVYPTIVTGIYLLVRKRNPGRDWTGLIDALIVTIGLGVLSWLFLISPNALADGVTLTQKFVAAAYPLMDVLLLAFAMRLALGGGRKNGSFWLMIAAVVSLLAVDSAYGWWNLNLSSPYAPPGVLDPGWLAFYFLFAASALHPSMAEVSEATVPSHRLSPSRLALLGAAAIVGPSLELWKAVQGGQVDMIAISIATMVIFMLVVARMAGLIRTEQAARDRDHALSEAGATLVAATGPEAVHAAAAEAALTLVGTSACVWILDAEVTAAAVSRTSNTGSCAALPPAKIDAIGRERLENGRSVVYEGAAAVSQTIFLPLFVLDEVTGVMALTTRTVTGPVRSALETLAFQTSLALESSILTEDLVRSQSEARFSSLVQNSSDVIAVAAADSTITYVSPSVERVLGHPAEEIEGRRLTEFLGGDEETRLLLGIAGSTVGGHPQSLEASLRHADGSPLTVEIAITNLSGDENVNGYVLNIRDVSERKQFEAQLTHQAFHDAVTGLANRALFRDRVQHSMDRASRAGTNVAVLFLDLDDFKTVNDSLGHHAGDQLLVGVAERIGRCIGPADTAARLGGDEFAILLEDNADEASAPDAAGRILEALNPPFLIEGKEVFVRASLGISYAEGEVETAEELLRNADVAMYTAKEAGKGHWEIFAPAMHKTVLERLELKADLQTAIDRGGLELFYQPIVDLETQRLKGFEALVRWPHPKHGYVSPANFIPMAEDTGLILPIGRWVLRTACIEAVKLQQTYGSELTMSVNISGRQLTRAEIVDEVRDVILETGIDPASLVLELTESVMMQDMELSIQRMNELKALGIKLAVDDFGTGYSSLNYIRRFPVDILKVDKSFIDGVDGEGEEAQLTEAILGLAEILGLRPVAEGIEELVQVDRLRDLKCAYGQGYFFAKPMPQADAHAFVASMRNGLFEGLDQAA